MLHVSNLKDHQKAQKIKGIEVKGFESFINAFIV
jgi:hypothetical protein